MHTVVIIVQTLELEGGRAGEKEGRNTGGYRDRDGDRRCTNVA